MLQNTQVKSLKHSLFYMHTLFTCLIALSICITLSTLFIVQNHSQTKNHMKQWSNIVHTHAQSTMLSDNHTGLKVLLLNFKEVAAVNFISVYKKTNDKLFLIADYHKNNIASSYSLNKVKISNLHRPTFTQGAIEYIKPINDVENNIVGYIHIQANVNEAKKMLPLLIIISLTAVFFVLLLSVLLVTKFHNTVIAQINNITTTIQTISRYKNYKTLFSSHAYKEIDILSKTLNIMLARIDKDHVNKEHNQYELSRLNTELENKITSRTEALKESNQELLTTLEKLHQFQGQLVENEKMASLGDMVAGIAHEVNTPIGLGVTASSLLSDKLQEIKGSYDNKTLKGSQLKRFLDESDKSISIVIRNLNRAAQLISSFKQVAVDQSNEETRHFNVKQLIDEVCLTLAPQLSHTNYNINIECDESLYVNAKAGPLNQIFINLIMNSKIHGFNHSIEGDITITVMSLSNQLNIIYQDNGVGIDSLLKAKIFEPFVTTKRGQGGSGLGLHLVYNLVTQALGGSIQLESTQGNGATFEINIPI